MNNISNRLFKTLKTWRGSITCVIACLLMSGCLKEELDIAVPKPGAVQVQLHNFNTPLNGGTLDGSAPDIYYFKQKEDGSFVFMLTSINYKGFETNWATEYVIVNTDKNGIIQTTKVMKLPVKDGFIGRFDFVWDTPYSFNWYGYNTTQITAGPSYVADDKGFLYSRPLLSGCYCANQFFNLNPETGKADYFLIGADVYLAKTFRTSDGGFINIGGWWTPDYEKYSEAGSFQYRQPMKYWEARPSYTYLEDRDGDSYFIVLYNGRFLSISSMGMLLSFDLDLEWFTENTAKSFFNFKEHYLDNFSAPPVDLEIRFGPGKTQKAHRIIPKGNYNYEYKDYIDVPFEVWDITNDRQVMTAFRDQAADGSFNLIQKKIDFTLEDSDPSWSFEYLSIFPDIPYASQPDQTIISNSFNEFRLLKKFYILGYLTEGATWDETSLPESTFSIKSGPRPGPQLIKVNANGSSVVKDNYILGSVPFKTLYKSVPYQDGFATLINAPQISDDAPTQIVILDAAFKQKDVISMTSTAADYGHQLEGSNDRVFYSRITTSPNSNGSKRSLLLSVVRNNMKIDRSLDDVLKIGDLENYRITPTRTGGVAIVAWVRPTDNTRDLIFVEFDENLKPIASPNGN